jgi:hypothetical protein
MYVLSPGSLRWLRPDDGETHHDRSLLVIILLLCLGLLYYMCHARTLSCSSTCKELSTGIIPADIIQHRALLSENHVYIYGVIVFVAYLWRTLVTAIHCCYFKISRTASLRTLFGFQLYVAVTLVLHCEGATWNVFTSSADTLLSLL